MSTSGRAELIGARTNVPVWPDTPDTMITDLVGTRVHLISIEAPELTRSLAAALAAASVTQMAADVDELTAVAIAGKVGAAALTGDRVALVGPEVDVLLLRSHLLAAGFARAEVRMHATSADVVRVRCGHCRAESIVHARPGAVITCSGCGLNLYIHHHLSPLHAAYLGFRSDAEHPDTQAKAAS